VTDSHDDLLAALEAVRDENTRLLRELEVETKRAEKAEAERDSLKAQVQAAREAAERIVKTQWRMPDCYITATAILRAMDEAAKK
jgi:cell division septum initiation protein DivIVA